MLRPPKVFSRFFTALFLVLICCKGTAQQLNFRTFSYAEGLVSVNIFNTVQDERGFVWVATQDGLYRYNGASFQQFKSNTVNGIHTPGNAFMFAAADQQGHIYAADYQQGIDVIRVTDLQVQSRNAADPAFAALPNFWIWGIYFDNRQNLWLRGTTYLACKRPSDKQFTIIRSFPGFSGDFTPSFVKPFGKNHVAAGIPGYGTVIYETGTLKQVQVIRQFKPGLQNTVMDARDIVMRNDTLFVATDNRIILGRWKENTWTFIREYKSPSFKEPLFSCMVFDRQGVLWIGSNNGLIRATPDLSRFDHFQTEAGNKRWLADNTIRHLMIDREDNLWISTSNVLQVVNTRSNGFTAFNGTGDAMDHIYTLAKKNDTTIFATGTNGLFEVGLHTGVSRKIHGTENLGFVHHVEPLQPGEWLISSDKGMYLYQQSSETISQEKLLSRYPEWKPFVKNYFNTVFRYQQSWYWASEESEGLLKWTPELHRLEQFKAGGTRSHGLPENHLRNLKPDKEGYLWILSDFTATKFDVKKDTVVSVIRRSGATFNANLLFDFYDDGRTYWFASYGGGINGLNKKTGQWVYFTEQEGLSNNCVYGLLPENDSVIWATTNMGLSRVNTRTLRCFNYYYEDGLQDNSFDEKGTLPDSPFLYFGGIRGFTRLDPSMLDLNQDTLPVFIYKIEYYNGKQREELNRLEWDEVVLPPGTSAIRIYLSVLSFSGNNKHRFSYSIAGLQDQFIDVDKDNVISLAGLSSGEKQILIRYRNKDGSFAAKQLSLRLLIRPYWYEQIWFKILLLLLIAALAYAFYRMRINQFKKEKQIRSQLASDLHDDLGSTLNSIKVYSNLALLEKENNTDYLVQIKQGTLEAIAGVKDIIWVLDDKKDSLGDMLIRVEQFARPLCQASSIQFRVQTDSEMQNLPLEKNEKRNLYMMIKESINNSLKYAGCAAITVQVVKKNKGWKLIIEDDGKGFDPASIKDGYGLQNMENRAKDIGYRFSLDAAAGKGTRIMLEKE